MKKTVLILLGIYLISNLSVAQNNDNTSARFDSIYFDAAVNWAKKDYHRALAISDSLYTHTTAPVHQLKALMLTASLYEQLGQREYAIEYALRADKIATQINDYEWQAKIAGFLSTQYRNLGLLNSGRKILEKGLKIIENVRDDKKRNFYYALVNQEFAYSEIDLKNYPKAKEFIGKSAYYFDLLDESSNIAFYKATNEQLLASCEFSLGNYDKSDEYLDRALLLLDRSSLGESVLRGMIFNGKAQVLRKRKAYPEALVYFEKAERIAVSSGFLSLKLSIYKELSEYYKEIGDTANRELYELKYKQLSQFDSNRTKSTVDGMITSIVANNEQLLDRQYIYVIGLIVLVLGGCGGIVFYKVRKRRDHRRFTAVINELKAVKTPAVIEGVLNVDETSSETVTAEKIVISKALETKILLLLNEFEQGEIYLEKNISASYLATVVDTNTKYLSVILKKHRNKDFNNYIGGLRIDYIVDKLINHPEYKNYKISYLAEECGFSTHSKFTAVFKKNTGITPSVFLDNLNQHR